MHAQADLSDCEEILKALLLSADARTHLQDARSDYRARDDVF